MRAALQYSKARNPVRFALAHIQNAKLDADKVRAIRKSTASIKELAEIFGISESAVYRIRVRWTWKHIND